MRTDTKLCVSLSRPRMIATYNQTSYVENTSKYNNYQELSYLISAKQLRLVEKAITNACPKNFRYLNRAYPQSLSSWINLQRHFSLVQINLNTLLLRFNFVRPRPQKSTRNPPSYFFFLKYIYIFRVFHLKRLYSLQRKLTWFRRGHLLMVINLSS